MKIAVFGAGAVGGVIAAALRQSGSNVCLVARGAHLAAIRTHGLRLDNGPEQTALDVRASDRAADLGPQDLVIVTTKAHALPEAVGEICGLLHAGTDVVYALNGIPWWYFHREGGVFDGRRIDLLDPGGRLWREVGVDRTIGCVVNFAASVVAPGVVRRGGAANRLLLGEPDGAASARLARIADTLAGAGFAIESEWPIRAAIWDKLRRGAVSSALTVLTSSTSGEALGDPELRPIYRAAMQELGAVAAAFGVALDGDVYALLDALPRTMHRPSMLQDLDNGRTMEIDAQFGAPQHLARLAGISTPVIDIVFALVRARARAAGLYRDQD